MVGDTHESDLLEPLPTDRASVSAFARDLGSGETLVAHAPDRPLPPASNTKLITTIVGLDCLGPNYRFETRVHATDTDEDGRVDGDLVIEGRGTPGISVSNLRMLADHVHESGVRTVAGDIVCDGSWFDAREFGPGWCVDDPRHGYGAPSTALALDRNVVTVEVTSRNGDLSTHIEPDTPVVDVAIDVTMGDESDLSAETDPESGVVTVSGTLATGDTETIQAPVPEPLVHFGKAFQSKLSEAGVTVTGGTHISETHEKTAAVAIHQSDQLSSICREMNVPSENFLAETIARTVARESEGEGTWNAWESVVREFLDDLGVEKHRIRDGSGLSRYNHVPAQGFVELVEWALAQSWSEAFLASLPVAGEDGTLANRLGDVDATIRAKTGTLTGTRALSGVIGDDENDDNIDDDEEPAIVFSVQLSNLVGELEEQGRDAQDEFVRRLVEQR